MKHLIAPILALLAAASTVWSAAPAAFTVKTSGAGPAMILIPGLASSGDVWEQTVAHYQGTHTCHVLTLAGFAGTPAPAGDRAFLTTVREDLAAYIRDQELGRPIIVGHSLGAFLALDLATTHPELPGAIVLVDGLPFFFGVMQANATIDDARRVAGPMAANHRRMDPATYEQMIRGGPNGSTMAASARDLDRIVAWGLASDGPTVAEAMTEMLTTDLRPALASIEVPALALAAWVGYAPYASHESIERIYREQYGRLEGMRIEITDTARHFIMLDEPEWMHARIDAFLAARSQTASP